LLSGSANHVRVESICGAINRSDKVKMRSLLYRATRGNAVLLLFDFNVQADLEAIRRKKKPLGEEEKEKSIFIILFEKGEYMHNKIVRVVDSFQGRRFPPLPKVDEMPRKMEEVKSKLSEVEDLIKVTQLQYKAYLLKVNQLRGEKHLGGGNMTDPSIRKNALNEVDESVSPSRKSHYDVLSDVSAVLLMKCFVVKEKWIHRALDMFRHTERFLLGYFWCASEQS